MSRAETLITKHLDTWTSAIKAKSSAGRGSGKKEEFYGIRKLRELILELAVRGQLVPQDPNDEPASKILKEIETRRGQLVKKGGLKKQTPLPPIAAAETPFQLPKQWEWCRFGGLGLIGSSSRVHQKDWTNTGVPFLRAREIIVLSKSGKVDNELFITEELFERLSKDGLVPEDGDLMITGVGSIGVPYVVKREDRFYFKDASVLIFKNLFRLYPRYLYSILTSPYWIGKIHEDSMGTTVHTLTISRANTVLVPIPPHAEQHRIVAKVDELMGLCDQLEQQREDSVRTHATLVRTLLGALTAAGERGAFEQAWQQIESHFDTLFATESSIDQLKQAILRLAVMGKLIPQDPKDEPASALMKRIAAEKARLVKVGSLKKQKALPPVADDEKQYSIPDSWEWVRLNDSFDIRDGTHDSPKDAVGEDTYPLVTSKDFKEGEIDFEVARRISEQDHSKICARSLVEVDDILFSMIGGNIGNQVIVKDSRPFSVKNVALFKYYSRELTVPKFLKVYSEELALELQQKASGGAQPFISLGSLRMLPLALPPIAEQHRIVAKVEELMTVCDRLKAKLETAQTTQLHLADSLVESAIR